MDKKLENFLKNNKYKLATIRQENNCLIYVDDLKAWENDTKCGEYNESKDAQYKKIVMMVEGSGFEIEEEYNCTGRYYGKSPILSDYYDNNNKISVGSTIRDLYSFMGRIRGTSHLYIPYSYVKSNNDLKRKDLKLCYIENGVAYFTNNENQWGDDWNDAPYQHNAGTPYEEDGYEILHLGFYANNMYLEPCNYFYPKDLSVEQINHKLVPWLIPENIKDASPIFAGETLQDFVKKINNISGYLLFDIKFENYDYEI